MLQPIFKKLINSFVSVDTEIQIFIVIRYKNVTAISFLMRFTVNEKSLNIFHLKKSSGFFLPTQKKEEKEQMELRRTFSAGD